MVYLRSDSEQATISKHEKEETPPSRKEKSQTQERLRMRLNGSNNHTHVQGPSTATCVPLTTDHNIPTSIPSNGCTLMTNKNQHTEFL
jgi:hypothetical protein